MPFASLLFAQVHRQHLPNRRLEIPIENVKNVFIPRLPGPTCLPRGFAQRNSGSLPKGLQSEMNWKLVKKKHRTDEDEPDEDETLGEGDFHKSSV